MVKSMYLEWLRQHHLAWPEWSHERWRRGSPGCLRSGWGCLVEGRGPPWSGKPKRADTPDFLHGKPCSAAAESGSGANRCLPAETREIPSAPERRIINQKKRNIWIQLFQIWTDDVFNPLAPEQKCWCNLIFCNFLNINPGDSEGEKRLLELRWLR